MCWLVPLAASAAAFKMQTLQPRYRGGLVSSQGTPTALAKGDCNADGSPDLIATYATGHAGMATIHRGNPA